MSNKKSINKSKDKYEVDYNLGNYTFPLKLYQILFALTVMLILFLGLFLAILFVPQIINKKIYIIIELILLGLSLIKLFLFNKNRKYMLIGPKSKIVKYKNYHQRAKNGIVFSIYCVVFLALIITFVDIIGIY